jgi:hypothetical protein
LAEVYIVSFQYFLFLEETGARARQSFALG